MTGSAPDSPAFIRIATDLRYDMRRCRSRAKSGRRWLGWMRGARGSARARASPSRSTWPSPPRPRPPWAPTRRSCGPPSSSCGSEAPRSWWWRTATRPRCPCRAWRRVLDETRASFRTYASDPISLSSMVCRIYHYAQDVLQADHLISIPKLKTHLYTQYTGAIKNMYGCLAKAQRRELHREMATQRFAERLVDTYAIRPPDLVIMDAILGMEGIGPTQGRAQGGRVAAHRQRRRAAGPRRGRAGGL